MEHSNTGLEWLKKNANWVNKIYLVTEGHTPSWLNLEHPKLVHIKHSDYMPDNFLPTYNSSAIELNLHRIKDLSENFVLFNDDMFVTSKVTVEDYYYNDRPKLLGVYNPIIPFEDFSNIIYNDTAIINKYFKTKMSQKKNLLKFFNLKYGMLVFRNLFMLPWSRIPGYVNSHLPSPLKKSTLKHLWELEEDLLVNVSENKIRNYRYDINQWILNYWQIESGEFEPLSTRFGKYVTVNETTKIDKILKSKKYKNICINDSVETKIENLKKLPDIFEKYYPQKSSFEK